VRSHQLAVGFLILRGKAAWSSVHAGLRQALHRSRSAPQRSAGSITGAVVQASLGCAALLSATLPVFSGQLQGQAVLSQPFPLPVDAVLDVQLIERGINGRDSLLLLGRSRSPVRGRSPFAFSLSFLDGAIRPAGQYQLRATIRQADRLLFSSIAAVPISPTAATPVRLTLVPVLDAPLRGMQWLRAPAASLPVSAEAPRQEQQFRLDPLSRELTGSGDCNRFIGSFSLQAASLRLEPAASTLRECEPEVKADEVRFIDALRQVRSWRLDDQGRLQLLDQSGALLLLMEGRP